MSHDEQHEADLARLISGELSADSEEGRAVLRASGLSASDLAELRSVAGKLDVAAQFDAELEELARRPEGVPGQDRVAAIIEGLAQDRGPKRWRWVLLAAGLLMILPLLFQFGSAPEEQLLGDRGVHVSFADEPNDSGYPAIEFDLHDDGLPGELTLSVYDGDDIVRVTPLHQYRLDESPWSDPKEQLSWPDSVHVRIDLVTPGVRGGPYGWAEFSRR